MFRYGQQKPCFVYRLVMDCCLEKKIYDRQINKQGMADRVVDECNPDAHLSIKEVRKYFHYYLKRGLGRFKAAQTL
jgi:Superfamily II DNA/RNA helicases, SNF2 family